MKFNLKWNKSVCNSLEASITKTGFPGLFQRFTAVILVHDDGGAMGYISNGYKATWANKNFSSVKVAKSFMSKMLKDEAGM